MTETEAGSAIEHFTENDWTGFARGEGDPARRARVAQHLEAGCAQCEQTLRLWSVLLSVAEQEATAAAVPRRARTEAREPFGRRVAAAVALVFDSFRQPELAAVRTTGASTRQLLYKAGRYTIKLQVEPGAAEDRVCIVGQILDDQDPAAVLRDIAVKALKGTRTLGRTHTNQMGEFHLEPGATQELQLSVDVPEIGTFSVEAPHSTEMPATGRSGKAAGASGRRKRARPR
jgi:anti-sigma factor RsiW